MVACKYRMALMSAVTVFTLVLCGCDKFVRVTGVIRDLNGQPIVGAKIHLTSMEEYWYAASGADGCFSVDGATDPMRRNEPITVEASEHKNRLEEHTSNRYAKPCNCYPIATESPDANRVQLLASDANKDLTPCDKSNF